MKENYTIILVDDEQEIKDRIRSKIPEDSGFEIIGEASNGHDAIELIEKMKPDIVITDIRMPYIDGIELATLMRKVYPKAKVAFISGYDEFEYAKEAVNLDVVSYLLKPVSTQDVLTFLDKIRKSLDYERQLIFNQDKLNEMFKAHQPVLIENQFQSLLQLTKITDATLNRFKIYDIDLTQGMFTVGMIEYQQTEDVIEMEQLRIFLLNVVNQLFQEFGRTYTFNSTHGLVFIVHQDEDITIDFDQILYNIILLKKEYSKLKVRIGVSNTFDNFKKFHKHLQQARHALTFSTYLNIGSIIYYKDVADQDYKHFYISKEELDKFSYVLRFGSNEEISELLAHHKQIAKDSINQEPLNKEHYLVNMTQIMYDFATGINIDMKLIFEKDILATLSAINNVDELLDTIETMVLNLMARAQSITKTNAQSMLEQALLYLDQNYHDPTISMDRVCEDLGVSVSYISTLFRKLLDTTFNRYLVELRIAKAKELLKYTSDKVYEVALAVGYNDVYYFSHSFKKETGKTPKVFRNDTEAK